VDEKPEVRADWRLDELDRLAAQERELTNSLVDVRAQFAPGLVHAAPARERVPD
jgi:hypothetical protein